MADNYLEKRMEDYRRGERRQFRAPKAQRAVMFACPLTPEVEAEIRRLRATGTCNVAFVEPDLRRGRALAQSTGARHYPIDPTDPAALNRAIADAKAHWAAVEIKPGV